MSDFSDFEDEEGVEEPVLSEEDGEDKEQEEEYEENPLTQQMLSECLSLLCKTGNGLSHAYVRLNINSRAVTDISILSNFIHLRYIDISGNLIRDLSPLNTLTQMLTLKADSNILRTTAINEMPYLQHINFADNKITAMEEINHRLLEILILNDNNINKVSNLDPEKLNRVVQLELRGNKLTSTAGLYLPTLKKLYLAGNELTKIEDLSRLNHLTTLHLRQNMIENLDGFSDNMKNLQYLNLRKNKITSMKELNKLKCLPMLRAIILRENPICFDDGYRIEVLVILRRLERLDQDIYIEEERQEAEEIYNQRLEAENAFEGDGAIEVIQSDEED